MNIKINLKLEEKILEMASAGIKKNKIAEELKLSRRTIFNVLKKNRVPEEFIEEKKEKKINLIKILSLRLLYYCDDYKLLSKMFVENLNMSEAEDVYIPKKIFNVIPAEKIKKIIYITKTAGLDYNILCA